MAGHPQADSRVQRAVAASAVASWRADFPTRGDLLTGLERGESYTIVVLGWDVAFGGAWDISYDHAARLLRAAFQLFAAGFVDHELARLGGGWIGRAG